MIPLKEHPLSEASLSKLAQLQAEVDCVGSYSEYIEKVGTKWSGSSGNKVFVEVIKALKIMMINDPHCYYCEFSAARDIEHIFPKKLYPECTFEWENYLYVCPECNQTKGSKFAVIQNGALVYLDKIANGHDPAFVNPRSENPMDLIMLDLKTFYYCSYYDLGVERIRADYTIGLLKLNIRERRGGPDPHLITTRQRDYRDYLSWLKTYVDDKNNGKNVDTSWLMKRTNPSVWLEMIRSRKYPGFEKLDFLFNQAPELLKYPP
ncbi:MAG: hypothetical protein HQL94_07505 [Magnetococcales bacterium]|nr:hypothetical protein [Magnetococcales bacterium]